MAHKGNPAVRVDSPLKTFITKAFKTKTIIKKTIIKKQAMEADEMMPIDCFFFWSF